MIVTEDVARQIGFQVEASKSSLCILHVKRGTVYSVLCRTKIKSGDGWIDGLTYVSEDGYYYSRPLTQFEGFTINDGSFKYQEPEPTHGS